MAALTVDGTYNVRGFGRPGEPWLVRAAALDGLTEAGSSALRELGIGLILDLRDAPEQPAADHDIAVLNVPIYRTGAPASGVLEDVYENLLLTRGPELTTAVAAIADATEPVLVHCAAGKDRTGLVIALSLLVAGATEDEVIADYMLSAAEVHRRRAALAARQLRDLELTERERASALRLHLDSPEPALRHAFDVLQTRGGVTAYLLDNGLTPQQLHSLRRKHELHEQS